MKQGHTSPTRQQGKLRRTVPSRGLPCWGVAVAAASLLAGCQHETPGEFQTLKEKQQSGFSPIESFPNDADDAAEAPLLVEVEPDLDAENVSLELPVSALVPVNVVDGSNIADMLRVAKSTEQQRPEILRVGSDLPAEKTTKGPRQVELLIKDREFRPEGPQQALRVNYDDLDLLKILNMEPVTPDAPRLFPSWLSGLDGQKIRIRGFMMPTFESTGLERFVLARDTGLCCFGRNPKVYDLISVELNPQKPSDYIHLRPFDVVGTFRIDMVAEGDKLLGLYWIEDAEVVQK